jgi:hypothetical protein
MSDELMPAPTPEEEIQTLRERIEELTRELETARNRPDDSAELRRQLADAQRELGELRRHSPSPPQPAPSSRRLDGFFEVEEP